MRLSSNSSQFSTNENPGSTYIKVHNTELFIYSSEILLCQPFLEIREGRHPCVCKTYGGGDFIPNDTVIGRWDPSSDEKSSPCVVVTGPNMGGKSTLMRQVGLIVIIAQLVRQFL